MRRFSSNEPKRIGGIMPKEALERAKTNPGVDFVDLLTLSIDYLEARREGESDEDDEDELEKKAHGLARMLFDWRYDEAFDDCSTAEEIFDEWRSGRAFAEDEAGLGRRARIFARADVPPLFAEAELSNFPDAVKNRALVALDRRSTLTVLGPVQVGKSRLAAAILRAIVESGGSSIQWANVPKLLTRIRLTFGKGGDKDAAVEALERHVSVDWLVLDDLGAEAASDWSWETVFVVLNERIEAGLPTIVTSNLSIHDLQRSRAPIAARLTRHMVIGLAEGGGRDTTRERGGLDFEQGDRSSGKSGA